MADEFTYDAPQCIDFHKIDDELPNDTYFDRTEETIIAHPNQCANLYEDVSETENCELSDPESESFFTPMSNRAVSNSNSFLYLKTKLRKSCSMNSLPISDPKSEDLSSELESVNLNGEHGQARPNSACSQEYRVVKAASREHINRLAQPKKFSSQEGINKIEGMTLAEAVNKFQAGTPKRFRSKPSPKLKKSLPVSYAGTKPLSPKFKTATRVRPNTAISKEEQEQREIEEAKKFKIKAHPLNKKILKGPLKPQVDKKPPTAIEPFHLTEVKKKSVVNEAKPVTIFKAQPLPKSLNKPFKVTTSAQPTTKGQSPSFSKRLSKTTQNKVEQAEKNRKTSQHFKPSRTQIIPFSFEKRDQELMKRKEEFINREYEKEKKAREFHANPLPKSILRSRNASQDKLNEGGSVKSFKCSTEDLQPPIFKARPATVLMAKPFEPKRDETHMVKIEAFQFSTDQRLEARQQFEERLKQKQAEAEAYKREREEALKKLEEEEIAKLRKQMEHKAQPIKKYKEMTIYPAEKVTSPISPKFHTDKIRNKENIRHQ